MKYVELRPDLVRVLGRNYSISYDHAEPDQLGETDTTAMEIEIADGQTGVEEADTVLHEIMHAVWHHMGIDNRKVEEHVIMRLSTGLTQVFADNPGVLAYLQKAVAE